ncbi:6197_t:CDS:2 [Dentiscutata heterogama]|uniref:6197_t:CDS:1 n=1 Tax=Dentiscutata heterogama TaxID=1316150 RepID=A0ACA9KZY5_9GLOM|nr:6197_t:CDS:2 [Dentiscutata heterogama]
MAQRRPPNTYPWSQRKLRHTIPFPRFEHSASDVSTNNELFIFGGIYQGQTTNEVYVIETSSLNVQNIVTSGDIPSPRAGHTHVNMGSIMIVFGGLTIEQKMDENLYALDTATKKWKQLSVQSPPRGRHGHSVTVIGTKMYIFGGQTEESYSNELIVFDMGMYNSSSANWEFVTPKNPPPPGRTAHISCAYENKIYMFGGMDGDRCYNDMWCYDINDNTWSQLSCNGLIPFPRKYHGATIVDGIIYIFGGTDEEGKELGDLTSFQISTQRWYMFQKMGPAPSPRYLHTMSAENEKIFVLGGESNQLSKPGEDGTIHILDTSRIRYPSQESLQSQQQQMSQQMSSQIPQQQIPQQQIPQQQSLQQQMPQQQVLQQQTPQQQIHQQQQIMSPYSTPLTSPTKQSISQRNHQMSPKQEFSPYGFNSPTSDNRIITQSPKGYQSPEIMDSLESPIHILPNTRINRGPLPENVVYMERQRSNSPQLRNLENVRKQTSSPVTARQSPTNFDHQRNNSNSSPKLFNRSRISTDNAYNYPVMRIRTQHSLDNLRENQSNANVRQQQRNPEYYQQNDFRNPRPMIRPPSGYIMQPDGYDPNLMSGNFQPGLLQNTIYQAFPKNTSSYIESTISSPTIPPEGHYRMSDTVDHSSANIMNVEYNEFMQVLEQRDNLIKTLSKREMWLKAELAIARKYGYTIDQVEFEGDNSEKVDLDQLIDNTDKSSEKFSLLLNIVKIKQELMKYKANIVTQAQAASQKITDSEKIRTAALQEAAYFKAKLAALKNQSKPDLIIIESERNNELEKRLMNALNEKETVQTKFIQLQQDFNDEKISRESAEERAKMAVERAEEAENAHAKSLTELAALHSRATAAETELREVKGQLLNSNMELKKSQNINEQSQTQITSLQQSVDNLKRTLEKANSAMTTASKRASESESLWKQTQQDIANLEKESAGLRSQLDVRMRDLSRAAEKANNLEKLLEEERKASATLREMMEDGVNKLLNSPVDDNLNDNSNMAQLEQEIAVLKNINEETQKSANEAANSLLSAKVKIVQMESTIMKARSENTALQRQLAEASEEVIRTKGKLSEKERLLEEKSRILEDTEVKIGMMRDVMSERGILDDGSGNSGADKVKEMAAQCEKLEALHAKTQNDLKISIRKYQEALKKVQEAENKSQALEKELERTNESLSESSKQLTDEKRSIEMKNNELQKQIIETNEKLAKVVNDYNTAMHYVQGTEKMLRRLKVELQNSKTEAAKLKTQLESMQKRNEELEEKLLEVQNRTSVSIGARESKIQEFANKQLELQREDFNKELSEIQEENKRLIKEHQQIKEELDEALSLNALLDKQLNDALGNQNDQESNGKRQDNWNEQKESLIRRLEKTNSELERKLHDSENRITILLDQMENTVDVYRNIEDNINPKSSRDSTVIKKELTDLDELSQWNVDNKQ